MRFAFSFVIKVLLLIAMVPISQTCFATIYVISNKAINIDPNDIADIYTGKKQMAGNQVLAPVDNRSIQPEFLRAVLHEGLILYRSTWAKKSFADGSPAPAIKTDDDEVLEFVKKTPGGIGYIAKPPDNKIVKLISQY